MVLFWLLQSNHHLYSSKNGKIETTMSIRSRRDDHRSPYQRDRARVLHSSCIPEPQAKTQVHGTTVNNFHRTNAHSLEAAQLGTGLSAPAKENNPSFQEICLPSDSLIDSLSYSRRRSSTVWSWRRSRTQLHDARSWVAEGNAQTFRIVTQLEPYTEHHRMNLSRRTLLGLIKYPSPLIEVQAKLHRSEPVKHQRQLKQKIGCQQKASAIMTKSFSSGYPSLFQTVTSSCSKQKITHRTTWAATEPSTNHSTVRSWNWPMISLIAYMI